MLHHTTAFTDAVQAGRQASAARRRPPVDLGEFERFLLASAGTGEAPAAVIRRLTAGLRATARAHRLSSHHAEDVVQSTWLRLLERHDSIRRPEATEAWMRTTAQRESLRILRETNSVQPVEPEVLQDRVAVPADHTRLEAAERQVALESAIDGLPEHQRRLMRMLAAEPPRSYAEIATTLGMPVGSIGPTRARALEQLRRDQRLASLAPLVACA